MLQNKIHCKINCLWYVCMSFEQKRIDKLTFSSLYNNSSLDWMKTICEHTLSRLTTNSQLNFSLLEDEPPKSLKYFTASIVLSCLFLSTCIFSSKRQPPENHQVLQLGRCVQGDHLVQLVQLVFKFLINFDFPNNKQYEFFDLTLSSPSTV